MVLLDLPPVNHSDVTQGADSTGFYEEQLLSYYYNENTPR